jgi:Fe-S cluster biogenesis protein NfuA/nitrite reductase/ring-hydroxylating ferredoxin subunit
MAIEPQAAEATAGQELLDRVEQLTAAIDAAADPFVRGTVDELVTAIIELYGEGLTRIVDLVSEDEALLRALAQDSVIGSLMLIHDLYPVPLETRVQEALASVRPYMESHGGDVELLAVENGVARMRLVGHCESCPASESTLELAIKKALEETAPDLDGLDVEGVTQREFDLPIVQSNGAAKEWTDLAGDLPAPGVTTPTIVAGADVLVANVGGTLLAYRNACGWCRARLDAAPMTPGGLLTCPSCERRFELRRAGRSPDDDALQIAPVPLLRANGGVRVAVA